jgi:hypothetical protein
MQRLWFCAVQFLLLTACAGAQSVAEAVQEFRLLGVWAVAAVQIRDGRLSLRQVLTTNPGIVLDVVLLMVNDKHRTRSSHISNGTTLVSNETVGRSSGHQTPWEGRCNERWAVKHAITKYR